ncbi:Asp-tRNAAsn/Glu-tRNAGln amidotransferase C subunit [Methanopyrus kandleri AV19]|uniref:Asp-tRNAAsn/Glu-tRNAGln amidotransferase C subunit n=1 Tax=Methanopyrus kandleri (strain AV19 / DSM 6324 / JCM 9639 / NBRC 100938) TaxID=190192 RepID=Q8TYE1_METKA|nr:Asp-tRNAAsn/Glu-tRNAGln amidotransferase C subunit [Methanopyrus kandleri AV19]
MASDRDDVDVLDILRETMELLEEFAERLEDVDAEDETWTTSEGSRKFREDDEPRCDREFKKKMLENAPRSDDGYVIAERAHWLR